MTKNNILLITILLLAFLLRFIFLSTIPPELNRDEVSVGFNAYSLLKTRHDEHGRGPWPLVFGAFGDFKIPGYIYLLAPLIKMFGLNAFTIRFPAAFFGALTVLVVYYFVKELFNKSTLKLRSTNISETLGLISSFLLAIAPFHLHYSRQQFEAPVALFFSLLGILFLLKARKRINYCFLALPLLIISFFIYNTSLFLIPLLIIWTFFIFRKDYYKQQTNRKRIIFFILVLLLGLACYFLLLKEGNLRRGNATIFNNEKLIEQINHNIFYLSNKRFPLMLSRLFNNKPLVWMKEFTKNYLAVFDLKFIFFTSDNNSWHSLGFLNFGNLLLFYLPLIPLGLIFLLRNYQQKEILWLFGYFLISPFASGLTIDSPILTRLLDFHLILIIFAAFGLVYILSLKTKCLKVIKMVFGITALFLLIQYLVAYFLIFPQKLDVFWHPGIKKVCQYIKNNEQDFDYIIFDRNLEVAYIFPAFYLPFNPKDFQEKAKWNLDGFDRVTQYNKFLFNENLAEWEGVEIFKKIGSGKRVLIIKKVGKDEKIDFQNSLELIKDPFNKPLWQIFRITT